MIRYDYLILWVFGNCFKYSIWSLPRSVPNVMVSITMSKKWNWGIYLRLKWPIQLKNHFKRFTSELRLFIIRTFPTFAEHETSVCSLYNTLQTLFVEWQMRFQISCNCSDCCTFKTSARKIEATGPFLVRPGLRRNFFTIRNPVLLRCYSTALFLAILLPCYLAFDTFY